jgi:nucleotide-binding universal stress UspA family protein
MYQKILVPLDGSELAECVLPHVKAIASGCDVKQLILLRVVEPLHGGEIPSDISSEVLQEADINAAKEYLAKIKAQLSKEGFDVEAEVLTGRSAEIISDFAQRNEVDLIALSTHGRSGISRWVFGSVADRVVRSSSVPVLLIRPRGCEVGI